MNKTALVFSGQGSQYVGMGKKWCDGSESARLLFEEADDALGFDLKKLCFEGSLEELTRTENTQPAVLTVSVAAYRVFMEEVGAKPALMAGHSLGEITALACSGAVGFLDAVRLVRCRGRFMQEAAPPGTGAMTAINGLPEGRVEAACREASGSQGIAAVSNLNSDDQIVVSGDKSTVGAVADALKKEGATAVPLKVSAPFHSPLMSTAAERMREELKNYRFQNPHFPVISNVDALPYRGAESIAENLVKQIVSPVRWKATMDYFMSCGIEEVIELGPKDVLKKLAVKNAPGLRAYSFDLEKDEEALKEERRGKPDRSAEFEFIVRCLAIAVCTRNRNWNDDEYRMGVSEPYKRVQTMLEILERESAVPTGEQLKLAFDMLESVFRTKLVTEKEREERLRQLFEETGAERFFEGARTGVGV